MDTVTVLMSTFNGEKYLQEQVYSIMNQEGVNTILMVRDDGSTDRTVQILQELIKRYPNRIELISGNNVGFKISFFRLLKEGLKTNSSYYAFSDQDDVWKTEKLKNALDLLKINNNCLYASAVTNTDENLNVIDVHRFDDMPVTIESVFTRPRLAGCTYVFTKQVADVCSRINQIKDIREPMPAHDFLVLAIALGMGNVVVDSNSYILHRRLESSVTSGGGAGLKKRVKTEINMVWGNNKYYSTSATIFLRIARNFLKPEVKKFLTCVSQAPKSISVRKSLLRNKEMNCGNKVGNIENKLKVLLNRY